MDAELLRGLLNEIAGDCRVAYGVTEESYRAYCRNGAVGAFPADTWAVHCQRRLGQIEKALASLSVAQGHGFVMVPRVPTENMVVAGFESRPDEHFSPPEEWAEYQAMSGCRQAAHRARLCWAAMLAAAPAQPDGVE